MDRRLPAFALLCALAAPALAVDGPALYQQHCAKCHGETGRADTWRGYLSFATDFTKGTFQRNNTDEQVLAAIERGPRIMPAYRDTLSVEERKALVRVVRGFGQR